MDETQVNDPLDLSPFLGGAITSGEHYDVYQVRNPRVSENMQYVWNYAVYNRGKAVVEVHTDTLPGALSMFLKLEDGMSAVGKAVAEYLTKRERERIQVSARESRARPH